MPAAVYSGDELCEALKTSLKTSERFIPLNSMLNIFRTANGTWPWLDPEHSRFPQFAHRHCRIRRAKNSRAGDDNLCPGAYHITDIVAINAAIYFDARCETALIDDSSQSSDLIKR